MTGPTRGIGDFWLCRSESERVTLDPWPPAQPHRPANRGAARLALGEGLTAVSAIAGAVGLMSGSIDLGPTINARLPFESPAFGGAALAGVVALPMAAGMALSWRGAQRTDGMAAGAGLMLMGWIVVELAVIRSFSWLHPSYFLIGGAIATAGFRRLATHLEPPVATGRPGHRGKSDCGATG